MIMSMNFKTGKLEEIKTNDKALNLKRGDVIFWGGNMGYTSEKLVILNKKAGWENALNYEVVNLKGSESQKEYTPYIKRIEAHNIKEENDSSLWHRQHYFFTNETKTEAEINNILEFIPIAKARNEQEEQDRINAIHESGNLTKSEKISYSTKDIKKEVSAKLKKEFPKFKFSIRTEYNHIDLSLMSAPFKVFRNFEELSENAILKYLDDGRRTREELKEMTKTDNKQLNPYQLREDYDANNWRNGAFLTEKAHNVLKRAVQLLDYYNYDNSDSQSDYFDVNFYLNIGIGRYDKPFKEVV